MIDFIMSKVYDLLCISELKTMIDQYGILLPEILVFAFLVWFLMFELNTIKIMQFSSLFSPATF